MNNYNLHRYETFFRFPLYENEIIKIIDIILRHQLHR